MDRDARNEALKSFFRFTDEDLQANRQGRMTELQVKWMAGTLKGNKVLGYFLGCLMIGIAFLLVPVLFCTIVPQLYQAVMTSGASLREAFTLGKLYPIFGLIIGIFALVGGGAFFVIILSNRARRGYVFKSITGPVYLKQSQSHNSSTGTTTDYYIEIAGLQFSVSSGLEHIIGRGENYTVYYADYQDKWGGGELISIEFLG